MVFSGLDRRIGRVAALLAVLLQLSGTALGQQRAEPLPRAGEANVVQVVLEGNSTETNKLGFRFSTRPASRSIPSSSKTTFVRSTARGDSSTSNHNTGACPTASW